ncbi:hypothetical protein ACQ5SP_04325 [Rhodovulum sp. YNF3179]|uniref:hypothetical protein n=1 Tax=Rhodovulum sp. YNF3179 TaxID=3425127 RepID=UPI003D32DA9F
MRHVSWIGPAALMVLAGCAWQAAPPPDAASSPQDVAVETPDDGTARPAPRPAAPDGVLGRTVASLGDVGEPGLWLKTPLVGSERPGRVERIGTGDAVSVTLRPLAEGGGGQLSLQAMQALGLPLTALPEVIVYAE